MEKKIPVFISYAHEDNASLDELLAHLADNENLDVWFDRQIVPGQKWDKEILTNLNSAEIVLFLVSEHFIGSEYIRKVEIEGAIRRLECTKIGIIVSPVPMDNYALKDFQALPKNATPISTYADRQKAWLEVSLGIQKVAAYILTSYKQVATEGGTKNAQATDKAVLFFVMLLAFLGLVILGYGLVQQSIFYIATAFICICMGLGGYFFARKYKPA